MIASPPSAWADAEREFHRAYLEDPEPFPRMTVSVSWMTRSAATGGGAAGILGMAISAWRHGAVHHEGVEVTVVPEHDPSRSMAFSIDPGPKPLRSAGESSGALVGGFGTNAVACLEVDGQVVWPTGNPIERPRRQG